MGLFDATMQAAAATIQGKLLFAQLHSEDPDPDYDEHVVSDVVAVTWTGATGDGDFDLDDPLVFTGEPGDPVTHVSLWDGDEDDTERLCWACYELTGDSAFNSLGKLTVTSIAIDGSAS